MLEENHCIWNLLVLVAVYRDYKDDDDVGEAIIGHLQRNRDLASTWRALAAVARADQHAAFASLTCNDLRVQVLSFFMAPNCTATPRLFGLFMPAGNAFVATASEQASLAVKIGDSFPSCLSAELHAGDAPRRREQKKTLA